MTSHAPTPGRPTRPCTAELLAAAELPATTAGTAATGTPRFQRMSVTDTRPVPLNVASPDCAEDFFAGPAARCVILWRAATWPNYGRSSNAAWTSRPGLARST